MSAKFSFPTPGTGFAALWPVTVKQPQDGGKVETKTLEAKLRVVTHAELEAAMAEAEAQAEAGAPKDPWLAYKLGVVDLPGTPHPIRDENGRPLPYFDQLLSPEWFREGLDQAFREFRTGVAAKN